MLIKTMKSTTNQNLNQKPETDRKEKARAEGTEKYRLDFIVRISFTLLHRIGICRCLIFILFPSVAVFGFNWKWIYIFFMILMMQFIKIALERFPIESENSNLISGFMLKRDQIFILNAIGYSTSVADLMWTNFELN